MKVFIVEPYGYCAGVTRALNLIEKAKREYTNIPFYCLGSIVHNSVVDKYLLDNNIYIINEPKDQAIDKISSGVVIFTAHGTDQKIIQKAIDKGLIVIDTTCPIVNTSRDIIVSYLNKGYDVIYIGKEKHPETEAMLSISNKVHLLEIDGEIPHIDNKVAIINQTTLSINDLIKTHQRIKKMYEDAVFIDEICNATRVRQEALLNIDESIDGIIVVGDNRSNNTKSLFKIASTKKDSLLVNSFDSIDKNWVMQKNNIVIISGTSASKEQVDEIYEQIKRLTK